MNDVITGYMPDAAEHERINARAERIDEVMQELHPKIKEALYKVRDQGEPEHRAANRVIMLTLASEINRKIAPHTACRAQCSGCCYQAVPMNRAQAEVIAQRTGRKMDEQAGAPPSDALIEHVQGNVAQHFGKPCPFLLPTGSCGCYDERPMQCRLHHSLADTPGPCDTATGIQAVPVYPLVDYELIYCANDFADDWADIREWFPPCDAT